MAPLGGPCRPSPLPYSDKVIRRYATRIEVLSGTSPGIKTLALTVSPPSLLFLFLFFSLPRSVRVFLLFWQLGSHSSNEALSRSIPGCHNAHGSLFDPFPLQNPSRWFGRPDLSSNPLTIPYARPMEVVGPIYTTGRVCPTPPIERENAVADWDEESTVVQYLKSPASVSCFLHSRSRSVPSGNVDSWDHEKRGASLWNSLNPAIQSRASLACTFTPHRLRSVVFYSNFSSTKGCNPAIGCPAIFRKH